MLEVGVARPPHILAIPFTIANEMDRCAVAVDSALCGKSLYALGEPRGAAASGVFTVAESCSQSFELVKPHVAVIAPAGAIECTLQ